MNSKFTTEQNQCLFNIWSCSCVAVCVEFQETSGKLKVLHSKQGHRLFSSKTFGSALTTHPSVWRGRADSARLVPSTAH